jgi:hypothetical protein
MKSGIHEERSRIVLYLPFNNPGEAKAVAGVLSYLKSKRVGFGQGRIKGFTKPAPSLPHMRAGGGLPGEESG